MKVEFWTYLLFSGFFFFGRLKSDKLKGAYNFNVNKNYSCFGTGSKWV